MLPASWGRDNIRPPSAATGSTCNTSRCSGRGTANISSGRKSSTPSTSWWISTGRPPSPKSSRSSSGTRTRPRRYHQGTGPWGRAGLGRGVTAWPAATPGWEPLSGPLWDPPSLTWHQGCCGPWGNRGTGWTHGSAAPPWSPSSRLDGGIPGCGSQGTGSSSCLDFSCSSLLAAGRWRWPRNS